MAGGGVSAVGAFGHCRVEPHLPCRAVPCWNRARQRGSKKKDYGQLVTDSYLFLPLDVFKCLAPVVSATEERENVVLTVPTVTSRQHMRDFPQGTLGENDGRIQNEHKAVLSEHAESSKLRQAATHLSTGFSHINAPQKKKTSSSQDKHNHSVMARAGRTRRC